MRFTDRHAAGAELAARLREADPQDAVVLALVRGGAPVADEVARSLSAPLDVLVVKKVGAPGNPEFGIGAVAEGGHVVHNARALEIAGISDGEFRELARRAEAGVEAGVRAYRGDRPRLDLAGRTAIVVDDGLATGVTAQAAAASARASAARRVVLAVPVGAPETVRALEARVDEVVCLEQPAGFHAVGAWYDDFRQVTDGEVRTILDASRRRSAGAPDQTSGQG